ncbi:MAG: PepSY domain-containing protein [Nannocystaceae bacterium]|nr:PepSY domain-containing protein [Nannocystaceae bacterium]
MRRARVGRSGRWLLAAGLACACETDDGEDQDEDLLAGVEITLLEAMELAAQMEPDGVTVDAELTDEYGDGPVFDIDRTVGEETREVLIDARTGEWLRTRIDPDDQIDSLEQADALASSEQMLTLADAVELGAQPDAVHDGVPVAVEVDPEEWVLLVVFVVEDTIRVVTLDLDDGSVLEVAEDPSEFG